MCLGATAAAHVPHLECRDFSEEAPYLVRKTTEQSIAIYAWLDARVRPDVDVFRFTLDEAKPVYVESLVPVREDYADFHPTFAVVGAGLPQPDATQSLPFALAEGEGAWVFDGQAEGRSEFFEPFGNKTYWQGPSVEKTLEAGTYRVYVWHPEDRGGDYVLVIGKAEIFEADDILRALIVTPLIRLGRELHPPQVAVREE